jgi:hypothetical protein
LTSAIVACGVLKQEVSAVLRREGRAVPVFPLAPAPCIDYGALGRQLDRVLRRAKDAADDVLLVIGRCHPDIAEITARHGARRLDVNDCFEALLGREERRRLDREANTFYTLPAWLPHWRRAFDKGMRWDEVDARQTFGHYERILLLDTGLRPIPDEQVLEFFDYTGVPVEVRPVDLAGLRLKLLEALDGAPPARS